MCCVCLRQPYFLGDGIYVVYTGVDIPYYGCVGAYLVIYVLLYIYNHADFLILHILAILCNLFFIVSESCGYEIIVVCLKLIIFAFKIALQFNLS